MALLRNLVAARKVDLKFFKPRLALQRASSPEQPRVPAGQPHAGERTREEEGSHSRSNYLQVAETCQDYIPANCLEKIDPGFPSLFSPMNISELKSAAKTNGPNARKAYNQSFDNRKNKGLQLWNPQSPIRFCRLSKTRK
jgi:hypothetical protein